MALTRIRLFGPAVLRPVARRSGGPWPGSPAARGPAVRPAVRRPVAPRSVGPWPGGPAARGPATRRSGGPLPGDPWPGGPAAEDSDRVADSRPWQ